MKTSSLLLTAFCLLCLINQTSAQNKKSDCAKYKDTVLHKLVYKFVDKMPEPVGGLDGFLKYLSKQIKFSSSQQEIGGRIVVAFVIEGDGMIDGERIVKDFALGNHSLGKQVLNAIKNYQWKPGSCFGRQVPVLYLLPFTIETSE